MERLVFNSVMGSKWRCSRCRSRRVSFRLDGGRDCQNCGQRYDADCRQKPSFDRRERKKDMKAYVCDKCGGSDNVGKVSMKVAYVGRPKGEGKGPRINLGEYCDKCVDKIVKELDGKVVEKKSAKKAK